MRPNPVATSSQINKTSFSRHASCKQRRSSEASAIFMPAAPCTSGSTTTAASESACSATSCAAASAPPVRRSPARARPGSAADRRCRCRSRPLRPTANPRCRRDRRRRTRGSVERPVTPRFVQYWKAILRACSTAAAPSDANTKCGSSTGTTRAGLRQLDRRRSRCPAAWSGRPGRAAPGWPGPAPERGAPA